ncbi:branched-chain alpha-ketoacid dehydrogenase [Elsinoe ampelina]|uniref:Protein-serine/threonine kinase n=1 Tax=Elsinoe ampelina TaxID=302913 RepID=A0A6A6GAT3_9PEZI|nr:branched-chain alpha-ketoacid dehydrogenase [Elsinoe ampelina]
MRRSIIGLQRRHAIHKSFHCSAARRQSPSLETRKVTDGDIARLAAKPLHPLALRDLVKHGRPPLTTPQLLNSANFTLSILPSRLAHRIQSLRNLPYIVVANPHVSKIHNNYVHSLSTLLPYAERKIESLEEEVQFTGVMADLVQTHSNTISILARGFLEARKYISPQEVTKFLDEHLRARIGTRLIAEQHIALHLSSKPHSELSDDDSHTNCSSYIGVIDTALRPSDVIRQCENTVGEICELKYGVRPTITIDGVPDTTFAHIPMHLEYIMTELLKNSFRATIENSAERTPIQITVAPAPGDQATNEAGVSSTAQGWADRASGSNGPAVSASSNIMPLETSTPGITIRIRDRGGGISPENYSKLWNYGFTTFNEDQILETIAANNGGGGGGNVDALNAISGIGGGGGSSLAGLGYGLPLGRAYAEYFGGGIAVQSLLGWGTDVYLSLRGVGKIS